MESVFNTLVFKRHLKLVRHGAHRISTGKLLYILAPVYLKVALPYLSDLNDGRTKLFGRLSEYCDIDRIYILESICA